MKALESVQVAMHGGMLTAAVLALGNNTHGASPYYGHLLIPWVSAGASTMIGADKYQVITPETLSRSESLAREFDKLVRQWKEETFYLSSLSKMFTHPAYQRIMAMGTDGLPLVLSELQKNQGNWFYALKYMAGKDLAEGIDNFDDARAVWLEWGYSNNYI